MARYIVVGQSGRGKSWKMGEVLEKVVPKFSHAVHFDVENEEAGLCVPGADGSPPVFKTFYVDRRIFHGEFNIPKTLLTNGRVRLVPDGLTKEEMTELLGRVCEIGMKIANHGEYDFHLSVDEAHNCMQKAKIDHRISRAVTGGRKRGLEWCIASQRCQNLHEDVLSQANWGIYFQLTSDRDLLKVDESTQFDAVTELPRLRKFQCIVEDRDKGRWKKVDTRNDTRHHPHCAADDGKADEYLESMGGEWNEGAV